MDNPNARGVMNRSRVLDSFGTTTKDSMPAPEHARKG
jgi:hypothetical protein